MHKQTELSGWGRFPSSKSCRVLRPECQEDLRIPQEPILARGCGRSYGDAALNSKGYTCLTQKLNKILFFNTSSGILTVEAGLTLNELVPFLLKAGWFLPVTPGTQFVTLGGCVASDVHGKNHHLHGSFGCHVRELKLLLSDHSVVICSEAENLELFKATIGGMGLTGIILEITFQLLRVSSPFIQTHTLPTTSLRDTLDLLVAHKHSTYSVAWIDGFAKESALGKGVILLGEHLSHPGDLTVKIPYPKKLPLTFFSHGLYPLTVKIFNKLYSFRHRKEHQGISSLFDYFYPLDVLENWNLIYGKAGFFQYQCLLPFSTAYDGLNQILKLTQNKGYLIVLKQMGNHKSGYLSFPREGWTLAIDCPVRPETISLLPLLDQITLQSGGRVYLSKDSYLKKEMFRAMYPEFETWLRVKEKYDPTNRFCSDLYRRIHAGF